MNQIIWNNSNVMCNNKILMIHKRKDGIVYLSDAVINNRFMN